MAVEKVINALETDDLSQVPTPYNPAQGEREVADEMKSLGNNRYFAPDDIDEKTWKDIFKDYEWEVEIEVTNEQTDKQAVLANLNDTLGKLAQLGDIDNARLVLSKILEETDIFSPMELTAVQQAPAPPASMGASAPVAPEQPSTPQLQP
jgi:hypothetical protein